MSTINNNINKQHEPIHNPNIFHQIAIDTNLKILTPTEYNHIKEDKTKNNNQQLDTNTSMERIALYQTIKLNRNQLNTLQTSNLISNKRKLNLIQNITGIDNKQSTLQTF